jgi:mono/diheme cytochrome c family protein
MNGTRTTLLALLAFGIGCGEAVPDEPTWFEDVEPILRANCARCHADDPYTPQVEGFRLDRYVKNDGDTFDAYDFRDAIIAQAVDRLSPAMPLDYSLSQRQMDTLKKWVEAGAPKGQRGNALPSATAVSPVDESMTVDQSLSLTLRTWDDDGDGLLVSVGVREKGAADGELLATNLGGGSRTLDLDTGLLASGRTFEAYAVVDDGYSDDPADNQHVVVLLSDILVDHGERGTAPRVTLLEPNGGSTIIGETTIVWTATDPDPGDVLTIDLDLIRVEANGDEVVASNIASGLANDSPSYLWDVSAVPAVDGNGNSIDYKVRVTATDTGAKNVRSDDSDAAFTIAQAGGETDLTWADVKPIFVTYCGACHGQPARTPKLDGFRLDKYDAADPEAPTNNDLGVFEMRNEVYQKLVVAGTMPPAAEPQVSAEDIAKIAEWILAGAPKEGGPADGPPTFTWSTPNNNAIVTTQDGNVALVWTVSDPEGLPITGTISVTELNAVADAQANCDANVPGYAVIGDADVEAGTYAYTAPNTGYFCFMAEVTDDAGQTVTAVAAKPIKYSTIGPPGP